MINFIPHYFNWHWCYLESNIRISISMPADGWMDWLIIYCFTSRSIIFLLWRARRIFLLWRAAKFRPMLGPDARRSGRYFLYHTCCDTGPRFFRSHLKDRPIQSPLKTCKGMRSTYSNPDSHRQSQEEKSLPVFTVQVVITKRNSKLLFWLFIVLRPGQEYFAYMFKTSPLSVKSYKI
jgi:hypothetical protein